MPSKKDQDQEKTSEFKPYTSTVDINNWDALRDEAIRWGMADAFGMPIEEYWETIGGRPWWAVKQEEPAGTDVPPKEPVSEPSLENAEDTDDPDTAASKEALNAVIDGLNMSSGGGGSVQNAGGFGFGDNAAGQTTPDAFFTTAKDKIAENASLPVPDETHITTDSTLAKEHGQPVDLSNLQSVSPDGIKKYFDMLNAAIGDPKNSKEMREVAGRMYRDAIKKLETVYPDMLKNVSLNQVMEWRDFLAMEAQNNDMPADYRAWAKNMGYAAKNRMRELEKENAQGWAAALGKEGETDFRSVLFFDEREGKVILVPAFVGGKVLSENEAIKRYRTTGEHYEKFDTWEDASAYANEETDARMAGFFEEYGSHSSQRVQAILADTQKKLDTQSLSAAEKFAAMHTASSRIDDQSKIQLIGNNIWYKDEAYPLYNPLADPRWENLDPYSDTSFSKVFDENDPHVRFDWANVIGGLSLKSGRSGSQPYTRSQAAMAVIGNLVSIIPNNLHVDEVRIVLQTDGEGRKRAYLLMGSTEAQNRMSQYAGTTQHYASNALTNAGWNAYWNARDNAAAIYENVTGKKAENKLDLGMTYDARRKDELYYAYVIGEKDGNAVYASLVYPGDRLVAENLWGKGFVYDLTDIIDPMYIKEQGVADLKTPFAIIAKKAEGN